LQPVFVDDCGLDTRQRQSAGPWLQRRHAWQWCENVDTGFSLPPCIKHRAPLTTYMREVPHPGFWIDGFTDGPDDAQAGEIELLGMVFVVGFRRLDQGAYRGGCGVEDRTLVTLDHLPESRGSRIGGHALEHDLRNTGRQWRSEEHTSELQSREKL